MTAGIAVDCQGLSVDYGRVRAVDGVSFAVGAGEIFGLLGPNAAGKTSVIRALTTVIDPSGGDATVAGEPLGRPERVRRSIGVLPESNGYPSSSTALGYLRFYGQLFGLPAPEADSRGETLLDQLGLGPNGNERIGTFSRGMRQRLGICRALINRPTVLFLDEPTLGLDPAGQQETLTFLGRAANEEGMSVVLCSHLLDEVERVCDRIAIMDGGGIVADGTVDEVVESAGMGATTRLRVEQGAVAEAVVKLQACPVVTHLDIDAGRVGEIEVETAAGLDTNEILRALLDANIGIRSVDVQGARLSDAFFALTGSPTKRS